MFDNTKIFDKDTHGHFDFIEDEVDCAILGDIKFNQILDSLEKNNIPTEDSNTELDDKDDVINPTIDYSESVPEIDTVAIDADELIAAEREIFANPFEDDEILETVIDTNLQPCNEGIISKIKAGIGAAAVLKGASIAKKMYDKAKEKGKENRKTLEDEFQKGRKEAIEDVKNKQPIRRSYQESYLKGAAIAAGALAVGKGIRELGKHIGEKKAERDLRAREAGRQTVRDEKKNKFSLFKKRLRE